MKLLIRKSLSLITKTRIRGLDAFRGSIRKMSIQPTLEDKIRKAKSSDKDLMKIRMHTGENKAPDFRVDEDFCAQGRRLPADNYG